MQRERIRDSQFESKPSSRDIACGSCGKTITHRSGRRPRFCSDRCRYRENGRTRVRKAVWVPDTGAPTKLKKKNNDYKALRGRISQSRHRVFGPLDVIEAEVWRGRDWQPAISSGGVPIEVGRLRARALVSS
jgi:hypothetical protein